MFKRLFIRIIAVTVPVISFFTSNPIKEEYIEKVGFDCKDTTYSFKVDFSTHTIEEVENDDTKDASIVFNCVNTIASISELTNNDGEEYFNNIMDKDINEIKDLLLKNKDYLLLNKNSLLESYDEGLLLKGLSDLENIHLWKYIPLKKDNTNL